MSLCRLQLTSQPLVLFLELLDQLGELAELLVFLLGQIRLLLRILRHLVLQPALHLDLLFQQSNLLLQLGLLSHVVRHDLSDFFLFLVDTCVRHFLLLEQLVMLGLQLLIVRIHTRFHFLDQLFLVEKFLVLGGELR